MEQVQPVTPGPPRLEGLTPVRPRRAFEDVLSQLKQAVIDGRLQVGDRLPQERELAKQFDISRQSVREGLLTLEAFGVLSPRRGAGPDSGWIVSGGGASSLAELLALSASLQRIPMWDMLEIRESLEMLSARHAATRTPGGETERLVEMAEAMNAIDDLGAFLRADTEFHVSIARASGNALAPLFMEAIRESMRGAMLLAFGRLDDWPGERNILRCEHLDIARKIHAGEGEAAALALGAHIRGFYGRALHDAPQT